MSQLEKCTTLKSRLVANSKGEAETSNGFGARSTTAISSLGQESKRIENESFLSVRFLFVGVWGIKSDIHRYGIWQRVCCGSRTERLWSSILENLAANSEA